MLVTNIKWEHCLKIDSALIFDIFIIARAIHFTWWKNKIKMNQHNTKESLNSFWTMSPRYSCRGTRQLLLKCTVSGGGPSLTGEEISEREITNVLLVSPPRPPGNKDALCRWKLKELRNVNDFLLASAARRRYLFSGQQVRQQFVKPCLKCLNYR